MITVGNFLKTLRIYKHLSSFDCHTETSKILETLQNGDFAVLWMKILKKNFSTFRQSARVSNSKMMPLETTVSEIWKCFH